MIAVVAVTVGMAPSASATAPQQEIEWGPCAGAPLVGADFECGRLTVPLDRTRPDGPMISLAVARHASEGTPGERIGSLVLNPGGPGGSGIDAIQGAWLRLPPDVRERFDLVTWDPRGVGRSTPAPADCPEPDFSVPLSYPPDLEALGTAIATAMARALAACEAANADLAPHLGTNESVADLEHLRVALGDPQLSYLGWSYGTRLGYDYALTYPDRVRAMILDGPMDPVPTVSSSVEATLAGVQAFTAFARAHPAAAKQFRDVQASLRQHPLALSDRFTLDAYTVTQYAHILAASQAAYPMLAQQIDILHRAVFGDGALRRAAQRVIEVILTSAFTNTEPRGWWVGSATYCLDNPARPTVDSLLPVAQLLERRVSPEAAINAVAIAADCAGYSFSPDPVPSVAPDAGPAVPMMISGSTRDGATPGAWIERLARAFPSARTVTYQGSQHTVWGAVGSTCVDRPIATFMISGVVPPSDRLCPSTYPRS